MKSQIFLASTFVLLFVLILVGAFIYMGVRIDYSTIDHITELQKSPNEFNDLSGDVDVHSSDDLGFIVNSDYSISIYYGRQIIELTPTCFKSEEYRERIAKIGLHVYTAVDEESGNILYRVTYWGEDIDQFSRVD